MTRWACRPAAWDSRQVAKSAKLRQDFFVGPYLVVQASIRPLFGPRATSECACSECCADEAWCDHRSGRYRFAVRCGEHQHQAARGEQAAPDETHDADRRGAFCVARELVVADLVGLGAGLCGIAADG